MLAPAVEDFVFREALRLQCDEFVAGARRAAWTVHEATAAAIQDDGRLLEELDESGSLTPPLHAALLRESRSVQQQGGSVIDEALSQIEEASEALSGQAVVTNTTLIIGAQRESFSAAKQGSQLAIGSSLVVCDSSNNMLWSPNRQTALLSEHGCSVQVTVAFQGAASHGQFDGSSPRHYTFEAAVDADALRWDHVREEDDVRVVLADINSHTASQGSFWLGRDGDSVAT